MGKTYENLIFDLFGTISTTNYATSITRWYYQQKQPSSAIIDPIFVDDIKRLSQKYHLYIFSNSKYEYVTESLKYQGIIEYFTDLVISSDIKDRKPSMASFQYIIRLGVKPEMSLFIDDRQRNRKVAEKLGFSIVNFRNKNTLLQYLKAL